MSSSICGSMLSRSLAVRSAETRERGLAHSGEAEAMDRGGTEPLQGIPVRRGAVALVVRQIELWVVAVQTSHDVIAGDLRDYRRRRDARRHHVPLLHAERGARHPG